MVEAEPAELVTVQVSVPASAEVAPVITRMGSLVTLAPGIVVLPLSVH